MLLERFRTSQEGTLLDQLFTLRQSSSVHDFHRRFEVLSVSLNEVAKVVLESAFVNGLREDIRAELGLGEGSSGPITNDDKNTTI